MSTETSLARPFMLDQREFKLFQDMMFSESGVTLPASKSALVSGRLSKRVKARNCDGFSAYHRLLQQDEAERQKAIDLLTTNETYFFREPKHFDFLRETVLPVHPADRPFRAWSAACSSGEEVYTIAMVLAEKLGDRPWSVLGSDINSEVLEKARIGHYGMARTEGIPRHCLKQFCLKGKGSQTGTFLVDRKLRARVDFRQINLNSSTPNLEAFDAIFLRNVMIYFSQETKIQVVQRITRLLRPGGYFFIGHSESLHGIANELKAVRPSVYRRAA